MENIIELINKNSLLVFSSILFLVVFLVGPGFMGLMTSMGVMKSMREGMNDQDMKDIDAMIADDENRESWIRRNAYFMFLVLAAAWLAAKISGILK